MDKVRLDQYYNLISKEENVYLDELNESIDEILEARDKKLISKNQAEFLLYLFINKEMRKEILSSLVNTLGRQRTEARTLQIDFSSKKEEYA